MTIHPMDRQRLRPLSRAPLRLSFVGGGTDFVEYYHQHSGMVISAALEMYVTVYEDLDGAPGDVQVIEATLDRGGLAPLGARRSIVLRRAAAAVLDKKRSLRIVADVPFGSGLGASSATIVALVRAATRERGVLKTPFEVAAEAYRIERDVLTIPVGEQDHLASAFGGINAFRFGPAGVMAERLDLRAEIRHQLPRWCMLSFTGRTRSAADLLAGHRDALSRGEKRRLELLGGIGATAARFEVALRAGRLTEMGALLDDAWTMKRALDPRISDPGVDRAYAAARKVGALGGKITGAGNGGFLLLFTPPDRHPAVREAVRPLGYIEVPVAFAAETTA